MEYRAVIIDDEAPSIEAIKGILVEFCENVEIVGTTQSPIEGLRLIKSTKPDILFLDIEMPEMNGFDLLESIPDRKFEVVFITAYDHYAIKAFKVNAIDYILKPINIKDVTLAVNKIEEKNKSFQFEEDKYKKLFENLKEFKSPKVHITTNNGTVCLNIDEIVRFSADGRYSMAYLSDGSNLCFSKTLKEIEKIVSNKSFLRIHKSHYINMDKVKKYNLTSDFKVEMVDGIEIEISRRKKDDFMDFMLS